MADDYGEGTRVFVGMERNPLATDLQKPTSLCITAMPLGPFPSMGNGEPAITDRPPPELILKTEMSLEALHTYTD